MANKYDIQYKWKKRETIISFVELMKWNFNIEVELNLTLKLILSSVCVKF